MKKIKVEGTEFIYFCKDEQLPQENSMIGTTVVKYYSRNGCEEVFSGIDYADMRAIVCQNPLDKLGCILYYLHWDNYQDLTQLDEIVNACKFTNEDFENSIKTYKRETECSTCHCRYITLVVPSGDVYVGAWKLMDTKIKSRSYLNCPNCQSSLRQMVVKIFG